MPQHKRKQRHVPPNNHSWMNENEQNPRVIANAGNQFWAHRNSRGNFIFRSQMMKILTVRFSYFSIHLHLKRLPASYELLIWGQNFTIENKNQDTDNGVVFPPQTIRLNIITKEWQEGWNEKLFQPFFTFIESLFLETLKKARKLWVGKLEHRWNKTDGKCTQVLISATAARLFLFVYWIRKQLKQWARITVLKTTASLSGILLRGRSIFSLEEKVSLLRGKIEQNYFNSFFEELLNEVCCWLKTKAVHFYPHTLSLWKKEWKVNFWLKVFHEVANKHFIINYFMV